MRENPWDHNGECLYCDGFGQHESLCPWVLSQFFNGLKKESAVPIDKPYAYHKPSTEGLSKINRLREAFSFVEKEIQECCPESRQKSIAVTNNEQTAMWAIKAVVFNDPKSEVDPA